jgi:hypothetical protein
MSQPAAPAKLNIRVFTQSVTKTDIIGWTNHNLLRTQEHATTANRPVL